MQRGRVQGSSHHSAGAGQPCTPDAWLQHGHHNSKVPLAPSPGAHPTPPGADTQQAKGKRGEVGVTTRQSFINSGSQSHTQAGQARPEAPTPGQCPALTPEKVPPKEHGALVEPGAGGLQTEAHRSAEPRATGTRQCVGQGAPGAGESAVTPVIRRQGRGCRRRLIHSGEKQGGCAELPMQAAGGCMLGTLASPRAGRGQSSAAHLACTPPYADHVCAPGHAARAASGRTQPPSCQSWGREGGSLQAPDPAQLGTCPALPGGSRKGPRPKKPEREVTARCAGNTKPKRYGGGWEGMGGAGATPWPGQRWPGCRGRC